MTTGLDLSQQQAQMTEARTAVEEAVADQEGAIRARGLWWVFVKYRDAYVTCTGDRDNEQPEDLLLAKRLLMSSSFIAAHFRLAGDMVNRDKTAETCIMLLWSLERDPVAMLAEHIRCEKLWQITFRREGMAPVGWRVAGWSAGLVLIAAAAGLAVWWFT